MTRVLFLALLAAGALTGLVAFAPLGAALRLAGADKQGLAWTAAEGTVLDGRLQGIALDGAPAGDAHVRLVPAALLSGHLQYAVGWTGEQGRGAGKVSAGHKARLALRDFDIDLDLLHLEHAARWVRQSGGRVQVQGEVIRFNGSECLEAKGTARSDVLERNREILGAGWSDMSGELRCERGDLVIPLQATNASGTHFLVQLSLAPGRTGRFDARVSGIIPRELEFALPIAGFAPDGRDYVYTHTPSGQSGPTP